MIHNSHTNNSSEPSAPYNFEYLTRATGRPRPLQLQPQPSLTDGMGTPDPQPQTFSEWVLIDLYSLSLHLSKLVIWALVLVGASDFIGYLPCPNYTTQ